MPDWKALALSRLRDIGWSAWDPIGLLTLGADWRNEPFADEYDSYLIEAASGLRDGWPVKKATDYLLLIASDHMGLSQVSRPAAEATAKAIADYLRELDHR
ncbi:hypothetical protein [Aminobacter carboxidus]|uniref:Uncharacterized protein n=1 Tax=Aminobacter carboxidus TaxID=376165 RepID=A0ABR9GGD3_9HYPH|nr:hypothetical protein [Aminobacter carboxidus]MBE1202713.1 hypothetical protein [Aminobacter carboxidus]